MAADVTPTEDSALAATDDEGYDALTVDQEAELREVLALTAAVIGTDAEIAAQWATEWDEELAERTKKLRERFLRQFAAWWTREGGNERLAALWQAEPWRALAALASIGPMRANLLVTKYRRWMRTQPPRLRADGPPSLDRDGNPRPGYSASWINGSLSTLRAGVRKARAWGLINWELTVRGVKRGPLLRDTKGPGTAGVQRMIATCRPGSPVDIRDEAILRLGFAMGLRRAELCSIAYPGDLRLKDPRKAQVRVTAKGGKRDWLSVPPRAAAAVVRYIEEVRGTRRGPLFRSLDHNPKHAGTPLTENGVYSIVKHRGELAGIESATRPHGLRHAGASEAYRRHGLVGAQLWARHASPTTTRAYIDVSDEMAGIVAADIEAELDAGL